MRATIEINGRPMEFEATAMTDHMADHLFGINLSYMMQHTEGNEDKIPDLVKMIAFIMNKRAELGGWRAVENLTEEDFFDWLDQINSYELENHGSELIGIYAQNKETAVMPKNTKNPQAE